MDYQLADKIVMVPLRDLKESPKQKSIHADFDPQGKDKWFVENIRRYGILVPLIILPDKTVKEGHRRMWGARLLGKAEVPCVVCTGGDAEAIMFSAILHRQVALYTKCIAYRDKIEALTNAGKTNRVEKLKAASKGAPVSAPSIEQSWLEVEQSLDVRRDELQRGVLLLQKVEALDKARKPEDRDRAKRIAYIFRNRGLKAALRMVDERTADEVAADLEATFADTPAEDTTPDMNQWEVGGNKREARVRGKTAGRASQAKQRAANPFTPAKVVLVGVFKLIESIDQFLSGALTDRTVIEKLRWEPEVAEWINKVNKVVNKPHEEQAVLPTPAREPVAVSDAQTLAV